LDNSDLVISTTSDPKPVVDAAAANDERAARVLAPQMEIANDGSTSVSYENPRSERVMLLERLVEQEERDLAELTASDDDGLRIQTNDTSDQGEASEPQAAGPEWTQPGHPHYQNMKKAYEWYGPEKIQEIVQPVLEAGIDLAPGIASEISLLPNSAEVLFFLLKDPWMDHGILQLNNMTPGQARRVLQEWNQAVGQLAEDSGRENTHPPIRKSSAPPPIRPIGGSATKSHVSIDDPNLSFQDYRKIRDQQQKTRFRR
jgi:hypothetical protein